jgi:sterol 3beta-glucosyltransferase
VCGGSRGDFDPGLALAAELVSRGHRPVILAHRIYEARVLSVGAEFAPLSGDPKWILKELIDAGENPLTYARRFRQVVGETVEQNAIEVLDACRGADCVLYASVAVLGYVAAEELGVPSMPFHMQPLFDPTSEFPSAVVPLEWSHFSSFGHRLSYLVAQQVFWRSLRSMLEHLRENLGISTRLPRWRGPFADVHSSGAPVLCAWNPNVLPKPADWPDNVVVSGYWVAPPGSDWAPLPGLEDFLSTGDPAVTVGFSSLVLSGGAEDLFARILCAVRRIGKRAVVISGWSGLHGEDLGEDVRVVESIPFSWLFPRCSAVINHGGAGTVGTAL